MGEAPASETIRGSRREPEASVGAPSALRESRASTGSGPLSGRVMKATRPVAPLRARAGVAASDSASGAATRASEAVHTGIDGASRPWTTGASAPDDAGAGASVDAVTGGAAVGALRQPTRGASATSRAPRARSTDRVLGSGIGCLGSDRRGVGKFPPWCDYSMRRR